MNLLGSFGIQNKDSDRIVVSLLHILAEQLCARLG